MEKQKSTNVKLSIIGIISLVCILLINIVSATYPSYKTLTASDGFNTSKGLQVLPQYVNSITHGYFMNILFLVLFFSISLTSYSIQVRTKGDANLWGVFAVVGLGMLIFMLMLSLVPSLVGFSTLLVSFFLEALFIILFFAKSN
jgi:hypothetical protein